MSPAAQAKAIAYTHAKEWLMLADLAVTLVMSWLIVRSGLLVKLRDLWQTKRPRPFLAAFMVALGFTALSFVLGAPWTIWDGWWFEKSFGMTSQPLGGFIVDNLIEFGVLLLPTALFWALLYLILRAAKRTWWLWGAGLAGVFLAISLFFVPIVVEPLLNSYKPAPPGPVRDAVAALGRKTGAPSDRIFIYNGSKQSNRYTANVAGIFGSARVAMSDVMFQKGADLAEVRAVVGHEMGHYVRGHVYWLMGAYTLLALLVFWLTDRLFRPAARLFGASSEAGIADPAALPVLVAALAVVWLLATPVRVGFTRVAEADADRFSLTYANEPDGLATALMKSADYRAPSPSRLEEVLFYDHPSVARRIGDAMAWKAKHLPPEAPCVENADHSVRTCPLPEALPAPAKGS
jgi:STE24 endopeptidase